MGNIRRQSIDAYRRTMGQNEAEGLLKTTQSPHEADKREITADGEDSKYRRVAKFLILIGGDQAAKILAELEPSQVEAVSREIASIRGISGEEGTKILEEFRSLLSSPYTYSGSSAGGIETARRILYAAMGPEKGETLLNKTVPGSRENLFGFLESFAPEQIALILKDETPVTAALIFSRLPPALTAESLKHFPAERRLDILKRIARKGQVLPEILEQVAQALREKARHIGHAETVEIDGMRTLAEILKQGDYSFGDRIVGELEQENPGIGSALKEKLYTLEDVVLAFDQPLQEKLKTMSNKEIAVLLKGRGKNFRDKILSCVSAGRGNLIREEDEILGAIPKRDCDDAARKFLDWFRQARNEGTIIISNDEDVFI